MPRSCYSDCSRPIRRLRTTYCGLSSSGSASELAAPRDALLTLGGGGNCAFMILRKKVVFVAMGANRGKLKPNRHIEAFARLMPRTILLSLLCLLSWTLYLDRAAISTATDFVAKDHSGTRLVARRSWKSPAFQPDAAATI